MELAYIVYGPSLLQPTPISNLEEHATESVDVMTVAEALGNGITPANPHPCYVSEVRKREFQKPIFVSETACLYKTNLGIRNSFFRS